MVGMVVLSLRWLGFPNLWFKDCPQVGYAVYVYVLCGLIWDDE